MLDAPSMNELLGADTPKNWGKWGPDDEIGGLNYLGAEQVLQARPARQAGQGVHAAGRACATRRATRCGPAAAGPRR